MLLRKICVALAVVLAAGCSLEGEFESDVEAEFASMSQEGKSKRRTVVRCESDDGRRVIVTKKGSQLRLTASEDGKVVHWGYAKKRVIEDGERITRIGYKTKRADLRIRVRDDLIEDTEGSAHLTLQKRSGLLWCDKY